MSVQFALGLVTSNSTSDLEQSHLQSFHTAVWLMMVSHQTEFGCKGITSTEDMVETIIWPPHCDLDLEDSKAFFTWHWLIMMHFYTTFCYKRLNCSKDMILGVNSQWHWIFAVTLTLTTAKYTFHKTLGDCGAWWCITVPCSVTKVSVVQKVPSGQTLNWILFNFISLLWPWPFTQQ